MSKPDQSNRLCERAQPHYRDFLNTRRRHLIPRFIIEHIRNCDFCRNQIKLLRQPHARIDQPNGLKHVRTVSKYTQLHFIYAGKPVACQDAKPFMPALLNLQPALSSATPITVHIDSCPQCQNDVEKIRKLNLGSRELSLLGRFFADMSLKGVLGRSCEEELAVAYWNGTEVHVLKQLRDTIREIVERPDSGVVTIYPPPKPGDAADAQADVDEAEEEQVEEIEQPPEEKEPSSLNQKASKIHFRSLLKPALAAAVIMLAPAMFFYYYTSVAKASTLEQVYHAVEEVKNVYIARYDPNKTEPIQEEWVSRELNISVSKVGGRMFLHDMNKNLTRVKSLQTGEVKSIPMDSKRVAAFCRLASSHFGMMPFDNIKDLPAGAVWENVTHQHPELVTENLEIYELSWARRPMNGIKKWRFFVDVATSLPRRIEYYHKFSEEEEYILLDIRVVTYPDAAEIATVLLTEELSHN